MGETAAREFGARLRQTREARGVTLRQIADETKISLRALEALEQGRVAALPGGIFRRALVRAYARAVGLDVERTLAEFLAIQPDDLPTLVAGPGGRPVLAGDVSPPQASRLRRLALRVIGAAVPLAAGIVYLALSASPPPQEPIRANDLARADAWQPEIVPAGGFLEPPPPAPRPLVVLITVTRPCDLEIHVDGRQVAARRFRAGEQLQLEARDEVVLTGDDAGAVQYSVNGLAGSLPGRPGESLSARITRGNDDPLRDEH